MIAYASNWLILFPVAFSLFVAMRLSQGSVDQGRSSWMLMAVRGVVVLMFWFAVLAVGLRGHWISLAWGLILAAFAFVFFWKRRRLERNAMFLTALTAETLPQQQRLAGYFADENAGWVKRKARGLSRDLAIGVPWGRSLEARGVAQGVYEKLALRLQSLFGGQVLGLSRPTNSLSPIQIEAEAERLLGRLMIFTWTILVAPLVVLIMMFILPTIEQMFMEFGLQLPVPTQMLVDLGDFSMSSGTAQLISALPLLLLAFGFLGVLIWLFPTMLQLPLLRWICADYYRNLGFTALAWVLQRNQELVSACQQTATLVPVNYISRKYQRASERLAQGEDLPTAFQNAGLLRQQEASLLRNAAAVSIEDPSWSMQQLAAYRVDRMLLRYSMIVQLLVVAITVVLAAIIGLVVLGIMLSLIVMISSLA